MELCPLVKVQHKVVPGVPLAFAIRDAEGRLLLAKGQQVADQQQLDGLIERGAWVLMDELGGPRQAIFKAPAELLPGLWHGLAEQLSKALRREPGSNLAEQLDSLARDLAALINRSADLALFLLVRRDQPERVTLAISRAVHAGICAWLLAQRLSWPVERRLRLVKAAFSMNLGQISLYDRFAHQVEAINVAQRRLVQQHPAASVAMLELAGVQDLEWLTAVLEHHERTDGSGYPRGIRELSEMGAALAHIEVFGALLSARATRRPMTPDAALRKMLVAHRDSPAVLALAREFGLTPPGTLVRLASGDLAVVVQRGADPQAPKVVVLANKQGDVLLTPYERDTQVASHRVASVVPDGQFKGRLVAAQLYARLID
jgi:hypothetical protein